MKLELEKRTTQVFLGVLAILALIINWYVWGHRSVRWPQPSATYTTPYTPAPSRPVANVVPRQPAPSAAPTVDPAVAAREAAQAAEVRRQNEAAQTAEAHARFLARYVNSGFSRKTGVNLVAVVAASEGKADRNISQALESRLKASNVEIIGTFFKPELIADGLLDQLLAESTQIRQRLELDKSLDGLILARLGVEYVNNPSLENVITAKMSLNVAVQALAASGNSKTWTLTASGAGFDRNAARALAEERILKAISADTKMSLAAVLPAK